MTKPKGPTLTCSEVVERLRDECLIPVRGVGGILAGTTLDRKKALAILHSWRERRVQELEASIWREAFRSALAFSSPSPRDGSHRRGDKIFSRMMELEWEANDKCGRELATKAGDDKTHD